MIPAANHYRRHAKIVGYGLDRISLMNFISRNTASVGRLFARRVLSGSNRNRQPAFGLKVGLDFEIVGLGDLEPERDRKSTRLNSSHLVISYAVFCLKKKKKDTFRLLTI